MIDLLLVDDHPLLLHGLAQLLAAEVDLNVTAQCRTAEEALEAARRLRPDVALVDISLPGMSGMDLVERLREDHPKVRSLIVSRHDEMLYAEQAIRNGAKGYLMKSEVGPVIVKAVRRVHNGGIFVSDRVNERMLQSIASTGRKSITQPLQDLLSDRERQVFVLMGHAHSSSDIAERLDLSVKTVESYRARLKDKLDLDSASELTRYAVHWVSHQGE